MYENRLSNTRLNGYVIARKCINSIGGQVLFALVLLSVLSIGQLALGDATNSPLLTGQLDLQQWITTLALPIVTLSLVYSLMTSPIELATKAVVLDDEDVSIYRGLVSTQKTSIPYEAIESVELEQSLPQRLTHFAQVSVHSDDMDRTVATLPQRQARKLMRRIAHRAAAASI